MDRYFYLLSKYRSAIMGIATLWVMLVHLPGHSGFLILDFLKDIGYCGVDIFLFLSGFGLYFSMTKKDFSLKQYYKRRLIRILPEFWFVLFVVFVLKKDFSIDGFLTLMCHASTIGFWFWGRGIPYVIMLWYISFILLLYLIFPFYFRLLKKYGLKIAFIFIGCGFGLMLSYALVCIIFFSNRNIGGFAVLAYARIPIFFIGTIFGFWAKNGCSIVLGRINKINALICAFIAFVVLIGCYIYVPDVFMWICSLYFIPFIIITPVLCILFALFFERFVPISRVFAYIGMISLELYMCHVYSYPLFDSFVQYGNLCAYIIILLVTFICAYSLFFLNKVYLQRVFLTFL